MNYPGDDAPTTRHFSAWDGKGIVGIASLYQENFEGEPQASGWRLRGMAVLPTVRRAGVGAKLVDQCLAHIREQRGALLWCNAREGALSFYRALHFGTVRGPFDIPGIGPHFLLLRRL